MYVTVIIEFLLSNSLQDVLNVGFSRQSQGQIRVHNVINRYQFCKEMFADIKVGNLSAIRVSMLAQIDTRVCIFICHRCWDKLTTSLLPV